MPTPKCCCVCVDSILRYWMSNSGASSCSETGYKAGKSIYRFWVNAMSHMLTVQSLGCQTYLFQISFSLCYAGKRHDWIKYAMGQKHR